MKPTRHLVGKALQDHKLPALDGVEDKDGRGRLVAAAGSLAVPGAAILCGVSALRAGAGKVQLATPKSLVPAMGSIFLEAGFLAMNETADGEILHSADDGFADAIRRADAVLVGPGMMDDAAATDLVRRCSETGSRTSIVLDAAALAAPHDVLRVLGSGGRHMVLTPHHGEMANLLGVDKSQVSDEPRRYAQEVASAFGCVVVLKADTTFIAASDGETWMHDNGVIGLATSGSGDVLAGIVAGLLARGVNALTPSLWAVLIHGEAGVALGQSVGPVGFLARELLDLIPRFLAPASEK